MPPAHLAVFDIKEQFVIMLELSSVYMPAALVTASLFVNTQSLTVRLLSLQNIPAPHFVVFSVKVQFEIEGLAVSMYMPAPLSSAYPCANCIPSMIVLASSFVIHTNPRRAFSPSMIVTSWPPLLCSHKALPSMSTT
jgi:hypothetical protein